MKKRIGLFGSYKFMSILYQNNKSLPVYNYVTNKLNLTYDVLNFSKANLTISSICVLAKQMTKVFNLKDIYLSLGETEASLDGDNLMLFMNDIKRSLNDLFSYLKDNKINANILLLEEDSINNKTINDVIRSLSRIYNITIINDEPKFSIIGNNRYILNSLYI